MDDKLKSAVAAAIEDKYWYAKQTDGTYKLEIYADYRDEMDAKTAAEICQSSDPYLALLEKLEEWYFEAECYDRNELEKAVRNALTASDGPYPDGPGDAEEERLDDIITELAYIAYHALASPSQDYRLLVFRQLLNGDVLFQVMGDDDIAVLARRLDVKPLHDWMRNEFRHIDGLTAADAAKLLIHLDELRTLLPGIRTRTDALLSLRNRESLARYGSIDALKADLCNVDTDWQHLSERMGLSEAFKEKYQESIIAFLCSNGAAIAEKYLNRLDGKQQEAFLCVVKAELMGQLCRLKYFGDDLQVELDAPLTALIKTEWPTNLHIKDGNMEVREHDDFFSTMLLGTQPQRTCLAYADGAYSTCLLSAFDSNKKVLYVYLNGRVVGRAFLRLTKGRMCGSNAPDRADESDFTFVDLEDASAPRSARPHTREEVTLFLERPYISGVGPELRQQVQNMLVSLALHKADDMGVMLVLSQDYRDKSLKGFTSTRYSIYISRSKAGAQYLDSLGGEAKASAAGDYYENTFLIRERR